MALVSSDDIRANSIKDINMNDIKEIKKELATQYMGDVFSCRTTFAQDLTLKIAEKAMEMLTS
jgi:hypothetical protein